MKPKRPLVGLDALVSSEAIQRSSVIEMVQRHAGLLCGEGSNLMSLCRAMNRRMQQLDLHTVSDYEKRLKNQDEGQVELEQLVSLLVVLKTYLYRDRSQFEFLRHVALPERMGRERPIRIWSAGCATGEEPYSLAITAHLLSLTAQHASVLATDLSRQALGTASAGSYQKKHLEGLKPEELACFSPEKDGLVHLRRPIRDLVEFRFQNLVTPPFPLPDTGAWDIIFCRNVMIYFDRETTGEILRRFHRVLAPDGLLFVGGSESLFRLTDDFELYDSSRPFIYKKIGAPGGLAPKTAKPAPVLPRPSQLSGARKASTASVSSSAKTGSRSTPAQGDQAPNGSQPPGKSLVFLEETLVEIEKGMADGGRSDAAHRLHELVTSYPEAARPRFLLGRMAAEQDALEEARSWMQAGLELDPLNTAGRFLLALVLYRSGLDAEAAEELRRLLFLEGEFALGHYYLGLVAQRKGDLETAIRSFRNAMKAQADALVSMDGSLLPLDAIQSETLTAASQARILSLEVPVDVNGRLR